MRQENRRSSNSSGLEEEIRKLASSVEDVKSRMEEGFRNLNENFRSLDSRVGKLEEGFRNLNIKIEEVSSELKRFEGETQVEFEGLNFRIERLNFRIEEIDKRVKENSDRIGRLFRAESIRERYFNSEEPGIRFFAGTQKFNSISDNDLDDLPPDFWDEE